MLTVVIWSAVTTMPQWVRNEALTQRRGRLVDPVNWWPVQRRRSIP